MRLACLLECFISPLRIDLTGRPKFQETSKAKNMFESTFFRSFFELLEICTDRHIFRVIRHKKVSPSGCNASPSCPINLDLVSVRCFFSVPTSS